MLVAYITPHGFGHATRTLEVLSAFRSAYPSVGITVVSDLPDWLLERVPDVTQRRLRLDVGIVQADAVRMDLPATLRQLAVLDSNWDGLVQREAIWLKDQGAKLVVCDIPAIPFEAAKLASVPSVALTSFSWDWIYSGFSEEDPAWVPYIERFAQAYPHCQRLLSYPFSAPMEHLPARIEVPLVAKPGRCKREILAKQVGADMSKTWLLFCLASMDFCADGVKALQAFESHQFFTTGELNWDGENCFTLGPNDLPFSDLVASVDAVVSKPGFGILSDCAANQKPIIYVERVGFREYPLLVEAIERHLVGIHLPLAELCQGRLGPALEELAQPSKVVRDPLKVDGASEVALLLHQQYDASTIN